MQYFVQLCNYATIEHQPSIDEPTRRSMFRWERKGYRKWGSNVEITTLKNDIIDKVDQFNSTTKLKDAELTALQNKMECEVQVLNLKIEDQIAESNRLNQEL